MNDFYVNDKWQKEQREIYLAPRFYDWFIGQGNWRSLPPEAKGPDVHTCLGSLEEKIVSNVYDDVCIETDSCTNPGRESPGWIKNIKADLLFFCMVENGLMPEKNGPMIAYLFDFPALAAWFLPREKTFYEHIERKKNRARNRLVPVGQLTRVINTDVFRIPRSGSGIEKLRSYRPNPLNKSR